MLGARIHVPRSCSSHPYPLSARPYAPFSSMVGRRGGDAVPHRAVARARAPGGGGAVGGARPGDPAAREGGGGGGRREGASRVRVLESGGLLPRAARARGSVGARPGGAARSLREAAGAGGRGVGR